MTSAEGTPGTAGRAGEDGRGRAAPRRRVRPGVEGLLAAALEAFYQQGYGGTTVRDIAARANVTVAALYHHFSSKNGILLVIMRQVMGEVLAEAEQALGRAGSDPAEQFRAIVASTCGYHTLRKAEAFVANSELRSLEPAARAEVVGLRDRYEAVFTAVIERGLAAGAFDVEDARQAARAVLAMGVAVSSWFRPEGRLTSAEVQRLYVDLALNLVRWTGGGDQRSVPAERAATGGNVEPIEGGAR